MRRMTIVAGAILGLVTLSGVATNAETGTPQLRLIGGETSVDKVVERFLQAIEAKDERAMRRLRVTEKEYREIIIPGTVKPGEPRRTDVTAQNSQYFWSMLNQKSEDIARLLIKNYGGTKLKRTEMTLTKGTRDFNGYVAHGNVRLVLEDGQGKKRELETGTIAEVGGRFKFIGFNTK